MQASSEKADLIKARILLKKICLKRKSQREK
jgi:hypothetical protein